MLSWFQFSLFLHITGDSGDQPEVSKGDAPRNDQQHPSHGQCERERDEDPVHDLLDQSEAEVGATRTSHIPSICIERASTTLSRAGLSGGGRSRGRSDPDCRGR
jgi:hypothetical protein